MTAAHDRPPLVPEVVDRRHWVADAKGGGYVPADQWRPPERVSRRHAPGLPGWVCDPETRAEVFRAEGPRLARWAAWMVCVWPFVTYARLLGTLPAGLWRVACTWAAWTFDTRRHEQARADLQVDGSRGDALALQLLHIRQRRLHVILMGSMAAAAATWWLTAPALGMDRLPPARWWVPAVAVALPVLGLLGRSVESRPLVEWLTVNADDTPPPTAGLLIEALHGVRVGTHPNQTDVQIHTPPVRTRTGWEAEVDLPRGTPAVSVSDVVKQRERVAAGLRRAPECVWLSQSPGAHAGRLHIVITRQPLRSMRMPDWPYLRGGRWNYFTDPVPVGINELGEPVAVPAAYRSMVVGGVMGSGKTVAMVNDTLAHGCDPRVEVHIYDLKGGADWLDFAEWAHFLRSGTDTEDLEAILGDLLELEARLDTRFKTLRNLSAQGIRTPKTTDELASMRRLDLWPIRVVIDETQEMFVDAPKKLRAEYLRVVSRLIKRGRAVGITVLAGTQEVNKDTLPIAGMCQLRHCLAVHGHVAVDLVLGTGAYHAGFHADQLTSADVGIGYVGSGKEIGLARAYHVDPDTGQLEEVCRRIRDERLLAGTLSGMAAGDIEPDNRTDGIFDHLLEVWPGVIDKAAYEDLVPALAERWPRLYGHWVNLDTDNASRALSVAIGPGIESVTCPKGDRRPRGVRLADVRRAARPEEATATIGA